MNKWPLKSNWLKSNLQCHKLAVPTKPSLCTNSMHYPDSTQFLFAFSQSPHLLHYHYCHSLSLYSVMPTPSSTLSAAWSGLSLLPPKRQPTNQLIANKIKCTLMSIRIHAYMSTSMQIDTYMLKYMHAIICPKLYAHNYMPTYTISFFCITTLTFNKMQTDIHNYNTCNLSNTIFLIFYYEFFIQESDI